jgi:hypothetical protein
VRRAGSRTQAPLSGRVAPDFSGWLERRPSRVQVQVQVQERVQERVQAPVRMRALVQSLVLAFVLAMTLGTPRAVHAAEIEGVAFDEVVEVAGQRLAVNGTGLREVYIVKTWVAALYTPTPVRDPGLLVSDAGPRRIAITLLADVSVERVARGILDAIRRNHDPLLLVTIEKQIEAFVAALRSIGPTEKRDTLTLDFADGVTRIGFNGMAVGEPIVGLLFRDALLRAFVGEAPLDDALKQGLLGISAASADTPHVVDDADAVVDERLGG